MLFTGLLLLIVAAGLKPSPIIIVRLSDTFNRELGLLQTHEPRFYVCNMPLYN